MSHFAGIWRLDGSAVEAGVLAHLSAALDGAGVAAPRVWQSGPVAFIHRQSYLTPEDLREQMPLAGASGSVLLADVRLDRSCDFSHDPDTDAAIMLRTLEQRGPEDGCRGLYGTYAFALWDAPAKRMVLGRDPGGFRSLFFHRSRNLLAFSTRLRALLALPEVPRDLDELAVAHQLIGYPGPRNRTLYRAIERVPSGHLAVFTPDRVHAHCWWTPPQPGTSPLRSNAAVEEAAAEVLDQAVAESMRSTGPVAASLTGGLDSTSIVCSAARQVAPTPLLVLTRVPDGATPAATPFRYHDESPRAQALAAMYSNVEWRPVRNFDAPSAPFDESAWFAQAAVPTGAPFNVGWFFPLYRLMASRNSRTLLSGVVGNGYYSYNGLSLLPGLFQRLRWGRLRGHLQALARAEGVSLTTVLRRHVLPAFEPFALRHYRRTRQKTVWAHAALNPAFAEEIRLRDSIDLSLYRLRLGGRHRSTMAERHFAAANEGAFDFWGSLRAVTGVDSRAPLNGRRLIEFFGSLPLDQFLQDGVARSLPRRLLAGRAPAEVIANRAFGSQNGDWFLRVSAQRDRMIADLERLRSSPLAARVIDLPRLSGLLHAWPADVEAAERVRPQYFHTLTQGMEMARFLAWHEGPAS